MRKVNTLKKNYEFKNVIKKGQYFVRKHIIIYLTKNNLNKNIIGIAVNTKLCNAVKRNRIKRVIRESFYKEEELLKKGYNIVFLWNKKEPATNVNFKIINKEMEEIFEDAGLYKKN